MLDGVSELHNREHPQIKFRNGELTGGEVVSRIVEEFFIQQSAKENAPDLDLRDSILKANKLVADEVRNYDLLLDKPETLPGASFAIAKIGEEEAEIIQAGDCLALWVTKDGNIEITRDQARQQQIDADTNAQRIQRRIAKEKYNLELEEANPFEMNEIREEMWLEYFPILKEMRRRRVNNPSTPHGYGFLNGQEALKKMWFYEVLERDSLETLLLFTDGLTPREVLKDKSDIEVARTVYASHKRGGLKGLLEDTRASEKRIGGGNWADAAEATAVAVTF
ncbi:protein phosphatase 2C family protein [Candidatus Uhrbacteria bacterium]|nr:protein phosphatase 2C family protein [Candidatus Uhrbacteria bacterium]